MIDNSLPRLEVFEVLENGSDSDDAQLLHCFIYDVGNESQLGSTQCYLVGLPGNRPILSRSLVFGTHCNISIYLSTQS